MSDMSGCGHRLSYPKHAVLYSEGEEASDWYEVAEGVMRTCRYLPNGNRHVTGFFIRGQIFGVDGERHRATAEAVTDVTVIRRARSALDSFASARHAAPAHPLSLALQNAEDRIQLLVLKGAPARMAGFLVAAAVEDGPGRYCVHLPMRQADIADYLAIDVATVNRILSRFVKARLISRREDQRYRINVNRLKAVAGGDPEPDGSADLERAPRRRPDRSELRERRIRVSAGDAFQHSLAPSDHGWG